MYFIPEPKRVETKTGKFFVSYKTRIVQDVKIGGTNLIYSSVIKESLKKHAGMEIAMVKGKACEGDIFLTLNETLGTQEYHLTVTEKGITIEGGDGAGVLYGAQTLCQMISQCGGVLDCVSIEDKPDLLDRGYYLDETRGRVLKLDYLKETVDLLCRYKINQFQLYIEHTYMFQGLNEMWRDETPLTAEEIMELDRYCAERHVELVPSMASFGHLYTLLGTKTYGDLCELPGGVKFPFSLWERMRHHTINVADERSLPLITGMLEEYMSLFTSNKFNICADETFDLGKGKAKALADEKGVHRVYIDFVKELCAFMTKKGKQVMFWGDIICGEPELIRELPENIICLTWGYSPVQSEEPSRRMAETGANQYLCPGVCGWNEWMHRIDYSYLNITRMCGYAHKYHAMGVLNTDWGDFGNINQPRFSVPGLIYGAAFSWNKKEIPFEEINRQISRVEFGDTTEKIVALMAAIPEQEHFPWDHAVKYLEGDPWKATETGDANEKLEDLRRELQESCIHWNADSRRLMQYLDVVIDGIKVWNNIGDVVLKRKAGEQVLDFALADRLEGWFMAYKELWRRESKEGDLHHVADIIFWYADQLRDKKFPQA